jgi:phage shock protein PspC (stress-responsive transcriptional regulator)
MNKVITINLGGRAYQLEDSAYETLKVYLDSARAGLANDPDKDEVMADFELAVAEKCDGFLSSTKNVVTADEAEQIVTQMGPVEVEDQAAKTEASGSKPLLAGIDVPLKKFYLVKEGSMIGGVCTGIAAYFNWDLTVVRFVIVILALTGYLSAPVIIGYIIAMFIAPTAVTPEEKAAARGQRFDAQAVIERARQKYAEVKTDLERQHREHQVAKSDAAAQTAAAVEGVKVDTEAIKEEVKQRVYASVSDLDYSQGKPAMSGFGRVVRGFFRLIFTLVAALLGITVIVITCGAAAVGLALVFGQIGLVDQLSHINHWVIGLFILAAYLAVVMPFSMIGSLFNRLAWDKKLGRRQYRGFMFSMTVWIIALFTLANLAVVYGDRAVDYYRSHSYVQVYHHNICLNDAVGDKSCR